MNILRITTMKWLLVTFLPFLWMTGFSTYLHTINNDCEFCPIDFSTSCDLKNVRGDFSPVEEEGVCPGCIWDAGGIAVGTEVIVISPNEQPISRVEPDAKNPLAICITHYDSRAPPSA